MKSRTVLFRLWTGALLILGLMTGAHAQRGGDEGDYQILQAQYGTPRDHVDVTDQLKELARQDRNFRMGNDSFGVDPAPGQVKQLRIYARDRRGQTRTFEYAEGSIVDGARFTGWGGGNWGGGGWKGGWGGAPYATATPTTPNRGSPARGGDAGDYQILQARYGTARNNVDVTDRLRELARRDRNFRLGNDALGGDPAPGQAKQLRIYTRSANGQTRTFEYPEGGVIDGAQFSGWTGGNWGRGGHDGRWDAAPAINAPRADRGVPERRGDAGEYQILQARYGTARNNVDVTDRLRELARRDRNFRLGNDALGGDPAPGQAKQLRIYTRSANGQTRTFEYPEGGVIDGAQFSGWTGGNWGRGGHDGRWDAAPAISAPIADRGAPERRREPAPYQSEGRLNIVRAVYGSGNEMADVTARLRERVQLGNRLQTMVTNDDLGADPSPSRVKTLTVTYTVDGGRPQEIRVNESQMLTLP